jgi:phosphoribosylaminoimidazole carboxylase
MLAASALLLNIKVVILEVGEHSPAKQLVAPLDPSLSHINGSFADPEKIRELAAKVDVLTVEIEHVDVATLEELQKTPRHTPLIIHPDPSTIRIIQDKFMQKQHLSKRHCPVSEFLVVESSWDSVRTAVQKLGFPIMLKSRTMAYDGRGNYAVRELSDIGQALSALGDRPLYAEKWVSFVKEIAVMVVKSADGEVRSYPAVETVHKDNICHLVFAPLRWHDAALAHRARTLAETAVKSFDGAGVFGVEMFLTEAGQSF